MSDLVGNPDWFCHSIIDFFILFLIGHPTQWQNMNLAGEEGDAQSKVGKNSVSVLVDHF